MDTEKSTIKIQNNNKKEKKLIQNIYIHLYIIKIVKIGLIIIIKKKKNITS